MTIALRSRIADWLIFAVFLAMGALLDARGIEHTEPDTPTYVAPAVGLSEGAGFTTVAADGTRHPEFIRTPVYPLYLAACLRAFGPAGLMASIWFQRIAWGLIITLAFPAIGAVASRRGRLLCAAGKLLCLLAPPVLVTASHLMSDVVFACLVALGLHATMRVMDEGGGRRAGWAGLLLGLATLTRPVGKLLPVILFVVWWVALRWRPERGGRRFEARVAAVFLIASLALPLGWSARNWHLSGHFTLTPLFGANLAAHRRERIATMARGGVAFGGPSEDRYARLVAEQDNALSALESVKAELGIDDFAGDALAARVGMQALRQDPLSYARDAVFHMFNIVMAPADAQTVGRVLFAWDRAIATPLVTAIHERRWSALAFQGAVRGFGLLAFLLLPLAVCLRKGHRKQWRLADGAYLASAIYFVVVTSILISTYGRFLLPVLPSVAYFLAQDPEDAA